MQQEDTATLEVLLKRLGLTTVHKLFSETVRKKEGWSYGTFFERLLSEEVAHRAETRIAAQVARAKFPFPLPSRPLTSPSGDFKRQMLGRFLGPELVSDNRSLILEGPPGTERHTCIAIAYKAIQNGFVARFTTAAVLSTSCTRVVTLITLLKAIPIHMYWSLMKWATWDMVQTQQIFSKW